MTFAFSLHISPANAIFKSSIIFFLAKLGLNLQNVWGMQQQQQVMIMIMMMIIIITQKMRKKRTWKHNIKELQKTAILSTAHVRWEVLT